MRIHNIIKRNQSYYVRMQIKGKRVEIPAGRDIKEAKRLLRNLETNPNVDIVRSLLEKGSKPFTYSDAVEEHKVKKLNRKKSGEGMYTNLKSSVDFIGKKDITAITEDDILAFMDKRLTQVSSGYCHKEMVMMKAVFRRQVRKHRIAENPFEDVELPKFYNVRDRILSDEEFRSLFGHQWMQKMRKQTKKRGVKRYLILTLIIADFTGMRTEEILSMRWEEVIFKDKFIHVPKSKNGDERDIPIHDELIKILEFEKARYDKAKIDQKKVCDHIIDFYGRPVKSIRKGFNTLKRRIGMLDFHVHDLRHRAITRWKRQGHNDAYVMKISGHRSLASMKRYEKVTKQDTQTIMGRAGLTIPYLSFWDYKEAAECFDKEAPKPNSKMNFLQRQGKNNDQYGLPINAGKDLNPPVTDKSGEGSCGEGCGQ